MGVPLQKVMSKEYNLQSCETSECAGEAGSGQKGEMSPSDRELFYCGANDGSDELDTLKAI